MPTKLSLSYYPWITQSISGAELAAKIAAFVELLQKELRRTLGNDLQIELLKVMEVPEQLTDLRAPPADGFACKIALLNPIGYALAHSAKPAVEAVAVIQRKIGTEVGPTYKAQLYTNRKTAIKTVKDARGRTMAFGSPQSTSNFFIPALMLFNEGIHPVNGFSRAEFTGGHDKAAVAVYEGRLDVGAGHDGVISDLASRPGFGDADQVLVRLAFSDPIPSDPVAIHSADPALGKKIADALCAMAKPSKPEDDQTRSEGNQAVKAFWGTDQGFVTTSPDAYAPLLGKMSTLGLRPDDMLRKI